MRKKFTSIAILALLTVVLQAEDIRVVVPYLGAATNVYQKADPNYTIDWEDTKLLEGLFFQWVKPELFQANAFVYHSADINYSQLWGGHLIGDFYVWSNPLGKAAVGAGVEVVHLAIHAGDALSSQFIFDFNFPLTVYVPYLRAGHYFSLGSRDKVLVSIFPWAGAEYDITRGHNSLYAAPPGPPVTYVDVDIAEEIVQETLIAALQVWSFRGVPANRGRHRGAGVLFLRSEALELPRGAPAPGGRVRISLRKV